jgi:hypothetical protein
MNSGIGLAARAAANRAGGGGGRAITRSCVSHHHYDRSSPDKVLRQFHFWDVAADGSCQNVFSLVWELPGVFPSGGQTYLSSRCILVGVQGATAPCFRSIDGCSNNLVSSFTLS